MIDPFAQTVASAIAFFPRLTASSSDSRSGRFIGIAPNVSPGPRLSPHGSWKYGCNESGADRVGSGKRFEPAAYYLSSDLFVCAEGAARVDWIS